MSSLSVHVREVLKIDSEGPAIEYEGHWHSWGQIDRIVAEVDAALRAAGLGPEVRVAGLLRNHPLIAASILAVVGSDRCLVTLNSTLPDDRLAADIVGLKPPAVVGLESDWSRPAVREAARQIGCLGIAISDDPDRPIRPVPGLEAIRGADLRRDATGVAIEMMTSGTTGAPKRVPLTVSAFKQGIDSAGAYGGRKPGDPPRLRDGVQILNAPFTHLGGILGLFNCVAGGRACCLLDRFTVQSFVDAVRRHRPKVAGAPPSALRMLLDANVAKEDLVSLVAFRTGTAPLAPELAEEFYERFGLPVLQNYGATEFSGGVAGWTLKDFHIHHRDKRGSVGRMNPGVEARIVDAETGVSLPYGQVGLLELRAPQLGDGEAWVRTTDLGVLDADNFLWINGRFDNAIIRGGFKVLPDDVVQALEAHPAILEAAVVGVADPRLGQVPAAAYILRSAAGALSKAELDAFLRDRLLPYQVPSRLMEVAELPRTPSMKVSQPELKALFEASGSVN